MSLRKPKATDKPTITTLLLGIQTPYNKIHPIEDYFEEFLNLVNTLGLKYKKTLFLKIRSIDKANYLTKGKLQELKEFCIENNIAKIVFSEILTPLQERNLEEILDCIIWDREKLILEIFEKAASTAEGKIQVQMAEIEFLKTRLSGKGIEFAQQSGMIGSKGPGETSKEVLKRHLAEKYRQAKKRLEVLKKSRKIQRKKRLESGMPLICLIGYTNAGKSSLINLLTKSSVLVENKLFATLDTTTRELFIEPKKKLLISDTVGFINQLPHHLIEAFKSTLDELSYANLLLHVVDISNPMWQNQIKVVENTLSELNIKKDILFVFNKKDKLTEEKLKELKPQMDKYKPYILTDTKSKDGINELITFLKNYNFNKK